MAHNFIKYPCGSRVCSWCGNEKGIDPDGPCLFSAAHLVPPSTNAATTTPVATSSSDETPKLSHRMKSIRLTTEPLQIPSIAKGHEELYRRIVGAKLIYKPHGKNSSQGIEIPFASLSNPLDGTFDLSECGKLSQFLTVSVGYKKTPNTNSPMMTEVWITPRFVLEKELSGSARYFRDYMSRFTAPIGLYWTRGSDDCTIYNTTHSMYCEAHYGKGAVYNIQTPLEELSTCNLIAKIYDDTMSPYDMLKPNAQRNMVRTVSCKDAPMLYIQF